MFDRIRKLISSGRAEPPAPTPVPSRPAAPDWQKLGNAALAAGNLPAAAEHYRLGTRDESRAAVAWLNLGYVQLELGDRAAARASLAESKALLPTGDPALVDVLSLIGRERHESRDWHAAAEAYRQVLAIQPAHEAIWRELAQVHEMQGDDAEAEACLLRALGVRGDFALALRDLTRLMLKLRRPADALAWVDRLEGVQPADAESGFMRAESLRSLHRLPEALAVVDFVLAREQEPRMMSMRGVILNQLQRPEEALDWHDRALKIKPDMPEALIGSSVVLMRLHQYGEATRRIDLALSLAPADPDAMLNKGHLHLKQLRFREAVAVFDDHAARHPRNAEVAFGASMALLVLGDFRRGWAEYESRWELSHDGVLNRRPRFGVPEWEGEPLAGKSLLVYTEQGLGDTLQALRFVYILAAQASSIWLRLQPAIVPLLDGLPSNCTVLPADRVLPPLDYVSPIMGLPRLLDVTEATIPRDVPYLSAPQERIAHWRERLGPARAFRVGLVWSGNPQHGNDYNRSIPLAQVMAHAPPELEFFSLQQEVAARDAAALRDSPRLRHFGSEIGSFGDTASIATLMDVVIAVDTSVAHLAGALGRPLLLLIPYSPDWRWLLDRSDSPWYPTARLFRQPTAADWDTPLRQVMTEVRARALSAAGRPVV